MLKSCPSLLVILPEEDKQTLQAEVRIEFK